MKKLKIKYNPYMITTEITIDGNTPKLNSALNVGKKRLQEWVEKLPQIFIDEFGENKVSVEFTGTTSDYEDVTTAFSADKEKITATFDFHKTADITDVEKTVDTIFNSIQHGPVPELKDEKIVTAFKKAKDSKFDVNVVATMSSGKSTLINAMLGQQLMPAANEATTATIVKIIDTDQKYFTAVAYDKSGQKVKEIKNVKLEDMKELNSDIKVSTIELKGKIPFVSSVGMTLVLVDTPGPNNSRDKNHEEMTYKMIADSDKSVVLYVMNGQQLGINDEKIFLDYVCKCMKDGGKQGRERFIFAVNKMDAFNPSPKMDGAGCIERALDDVKEGLVERGIINPNIFPVCSLPALELRDDDPDRGELELFIDRSQKYSELHFDEYYQYNNLPQSVRERISNFKQGNNIEKDDLVEIHTGIISIEQAVSQYINKYARTTKIRDLVFSFNEKLDELAVVAHLEDAIRKDKAAKAVLEKQIEAIKMKISSAKNAKNRSESIDNIDLLSVIKKQIDSYYVDVNTQISKLQIGNNQVLKEEALKQCQEIEKQCIAIVKQIKIQVEKIILKAYKNSIETVVDEYKKYLDELNINVNSEALSFSTLQLVSASLGDLTSIVNDYTSTKDESFEDTEDYTYKVEGTRVDRALVGATTGAATGAALGSIIPGIGTLLGGLAGGVLGLIGGAISGDDEHSENGTRTFWHEKYVDYVDMKKVSGEYLVQLQEYLINVNKKVVEYINGETEKLKKGLKEDIYLINEALDKKLNELSNTEISNELKAEEIKRKEDNLKWLEGIQKQVNNIIKF